MTLLIEICNAAVPDTGVPVTATLAKLVVPLIVVAPLLSSVKLVAGALPEKLYAVPLVPPLNVPVALSVPVTASPVEESSAYTAELAALFQLNCVAY